MKVVVWISILVLSLVALGCGDSEADAKPEATLDEVCSAASDANMLCDDTELSTDQCDELFGDLTGECKALMVDVYECVVAEEACTEFGMAVSCKMQVQSYGVHCPSD